jgi:hypothetical protein
MKKTLFVIILALQFVGVAATASAVSFPSCYPCDNVR